MEEKKRQEEIKALIRTAYFVAKRDLPFTKYKEICDLQVLNGLTLGTNYMNDTQCMRFIDLIAANLKDQLRQNINDVRFIAVPAMSISKGLHLIRSWFHARCVVSLFCNSAPTCSNHTPKIHDCCLLNATYNH